MNQQPGISFGPGSAGGAPTPAPIHDIVGPLPFFSTPLGIIVAVILLALLGVGIWWCLRRKRVRELTPREAALEALARLRGRVAEGNDHDFGVGVSDVLRRFLGEALGLAAPRQTTEEFLSSLRGSLRFMEPEQEALAAFLQQSDYLKYAQGEATSEQRLALIEAAESFVQSGEKLDEAAPGTGPGVAAGKEAA
jgi:hypothetical protein